MKHTKEPWIVHLLDRRTMIASDVENGYLAETRHIHSGDIEQANAQRIVACVNACADVDDDRLSLGYVKGLEVENAQLKAQLTWRPASELPEEDQIVIATYLNSYGKRRRVSAAYIRQYEEEAGVDDELCVEYCEEQDELYLKEGWYELIDNWDYSLAAIVEGVVDYWMPMPPAPEGGIA